MPLIDNRRNNPELRSSPHEVNMARPAGYKGKVVLSVWLESFPNLKLLVVAHEIGHWVLYLQGFRAIFCDPKSLARAIARSPVSARKMGVPNPTWSKSTDGFEPCWVWKPPGPHYRTFNPGCFLTCLYVEPDFGLSLFLSLCHFVREFETVSFALSLMIAVLNNSLCSQNGAPS